MKYLLTACFLITCYFGEAQTPNNSQRKTTRSRTTTHQKVKSNTYGTRDTTPGSPMGTGGAGGGDMSGSPAASAIETDDQTSKAEVKPDTSSTSTRTTTHRKRSTTRKRQQ